MMKISELAKLVNITVRTLHHYDELGLLKPSGRTESGYRLYDESSLQVILQIQLYKSLGFSLKKISDFIARGTTPIEALRDHLEVITAEKERLHVIESKVELLIDYIDNDESGSPSSEILTLIDTLKKYQPNSTKEHLLQLIAKHNKQSTHDRFVSIMDRFQSLLAAPKKPQSKDSQKMIQELISFMAEYGIPEKGKSLKPEELKEILEMHGITGELQRYISSTYIIKGDE